jgi:hypothetical protein
MTKFKKYLVEFYNDLFNHKVVQPNKKFIAKDIIAAISLVFTSAISLSANLSKVGSIFPFFVSLIDWVPAITLVAIIIISLWAIVSKVRFIRKGKVYYQYTFNWILRLFAKITFPISLLLIPVTTHRLLFSVSPLPLIFEGYLINAKTNVPIALVDINLFDADGKKKSSGNRKTDSDGYWIIKTTERSKQDAYLEIKNKDCDNYFQIRLRELIDKNLIQGKTEYVFNIKYECK